MYVKEIWRYPVKSMAGERLSKTTIGPLGIDGDRTVLVTRQDRIVTARKDYKLLGLKATLNGNGKLKISGYDWDSPEALELVRNAAGPDAALVQQAGPGRFDVLPLLIATDGAIEHMGFDCRRLRPNMVIGGVDGLAERGWPGGNLQIGKAVIHAAQLRSRCVMTTYDPDTLKQDPSVLRRIVNKLNGTMALDCSVLSPGQIQEGSSVKLIPLS